MQRYFLHIAYQGKKYRGWQRQPKVLSVQQRLEEAISKMLHKETIVFGCGRTDAGVHASQYFLHIDADQPFDYDPVFRLNKMLPEDIAVFEVLPMEANQHARYDASARTYDYFIHAHKDPFLSERSSHYPIDEFDVSKMQAANRLLTQHKDFKSFCKQPDLYEHTICELQQANLYTAAGGTKLRLQLTSNRFLRGMIRFIVARMLDVGRGKTSLDQFENNLKTGEDFEFKNPAYPQGLYLSKVVYPYLELPPRSDLWVDGEDWRLLK